MPTLSRRLMGEELKLPSIATWWRGQDMARAEVERRLDDMLIAPAFSEAPKGLPLGRPVLAAALTQRQRAELMADIARRPQDYVGQEDVHLSTTPTVQEGQLVPRPFTLRVFAARNGNPQAVQVLLESGVDVNARYGNNLTELMWVAGHEDGAGTNDVADILTLLIDHGARLDDQDNRGRTALMIAASLGHEKAVEILIARGANKGVHDKEGKTAMDLSANDALRVELAGK